MTLQATGAAQSPDYRKQHEAKGRGLLTAKKPSLLAGAHLVLDSPARYDQNVFSDHGRIVNHKLVLKLYEQELAAWKQESIGLWSVERRLEEMARCMVVDAEAEAVEKAERIIAAAMGPATAGTDAMKSQTLESPDAGLQTTVANQKSSNKDRFETRTRTKPRLSMSREDEKGLGGPSEQRHAYKAQNASPGSIPASDQNLDNSSIKYTDVDLASTLGNGASEPTTPDKKRGLVKIKQESTKPKAGITSSYAATKVEPVPSQSKWGVTSGHVAVQAEVLNGTVGDMKVKTERYDIEPDAARQKSLQVRLAAARLKQEQIRARKRKAVDDLECQVLELEAKNAEEEAVVNALEGGGRKIKLETA